MVTHLTYRHTSHSTVWYFSEHSSDTLDPELVEERRKTEDMVRLIREKLDQMNATSSGMVNEFDSKGMRS